MSDSIRIMVVDDHQVVRQGYVMFLKAFPDLELVGEAANGQEAVILCEELKPDVVLMDMIMPKLNGVEATRQILERFPTIKVIALTSFSDDQDLVRQALAAGATSYLFKDVSIDDLAEAIRKADAGTPTLAPEATKLLIKMTRRPIDPEFHLTERENEVLELLAQGLNNRQIAERLVLSRSTIKFHVSSILGKLGVSTRTEAVSVAHQHGLLD